MFRLLGLLVGQYFFQESDHRNETYLGHCRICHSPASHQEITALYYLGWSNGLVLRKT